MPYFPTSIIEAPHVVEYLHKRGLLKQYLKAKNAILCGDVAGTYFKKRKPYHLGVWYFRINQQYRAFGYFDGKVFKVASISDHQNN
jgi:plasmid maintenance system killer protein